MFTIWFRFKIRQFTIDCLDKSQRELYIHPIAETDNIKDLQHGWDYTLREIIEKYKKNNYRKISGNNIQSIKLIPFYKCTYCNKELSSEEEKKEHELLWHIWDNV